MNRLETINEIKRAVIEGHDVRCMGGGYKVIQNSANHEDYLIIFESTGYCIGLHGRAGTEYETQLNGRGFYYE